MERGTDIDSDLGELYTARQKYSYGIPPDPFPSPVIIGEPDKIARGLCPPPELTWTYETLGTPHFTLGPGVVSYTGQAGINCGGSGGIASILRVTYKIVTLDAREVTIRVIADLANNGGTTNAIRVDVNAIGVIRITNDGLGLPCSTIHREATVTTQLDPGENIVFVEVSDTPVLDSASSPITVTIDGSPPLYVNNAIYREGYDQRCYSKDFPTVPIPFWPDVQNARHGQALAEVCESLYVDLAAATTLLQTFLGPTWTITGDAATNALGSGSLIAQSPIGTVCVISGTLNYLQFALQVMTAQLGPIEAGGFGANATQLAAANLQHVKHFAAGVDASKPILMAGHSLGGAECIILAGKYLLAQPERQVEVLTWGANRCGDKRLRDIIDQMRIVTYCNTLDPIPGLPPSGSDLVIALGLVGPILANAYSKFVSNPGQILLFDNGDRLETSDSRLGIRDLLIIIGCVVNNLPFPATFPHDISEYARRLALAT